MENKKFEKWEEVLVTHTNGQKFQAEILEDLGSGSWEIRPLFAFNCLLTDRVYDEKYIQKAGN